MTGPTAQTPYGPHFATLAAAQQALALAMGEDGKDGLADRMLRIISGLRRKCGADIIFYHPWKYHARRAAEGWPDYVLGSPGRAGRGGGVIVRELKKEKQQPTAAQWVWLHLWQMQGVDAQVWQPSDLLAGRIARELAALAGVGGGAQ